MSNDGKHESFLPSDDGYVRIQELAYLLSEKNDWVANDIEPHRGTKKRDFRPKDGEAPQSLERLLTEALKTKGINDCITKQGKDDQQQNIVTVIISPADHKKLTESDQDIEIAGHVDGDLQVYIEESAARQNAHMSGEAAPEPRGKQSFLAMLGELEYWEKIPNNPEWVKRTLIDFSYPRRMLIDVLESLQLQQDIDFTIEDSRHQTKGNEIKLHKANTEQALRTKDLTDQLIDYAKGKKYGNPLLRNAMNNGIKLAEIRDPESGETLMQIAIKHEKYERASAIKNAINLNVQGNAR